MKPSPQQEAVYAALRAGDHNVSIRAVAGSGKTTTILQGLSYIPTRNPETLLGNRIVFLAFGSDTAKFLASHVPRGVEAATFHKIAFRVYRQKVKSVETKFDKSRKLMQNALPFKHPDFRDALRLVSLAKSQPQPPTKTDLYTLVNSYGMVLDEPGEVVAAAFRVIEKAIDDEENIDFDDMLCMPVWKNWDFAKLDWILVDEAQDTNALQCEIIRRSGLSTTKHCIVGDPYQGIYGFRGAGDTAMEDLEDAFSCRLYPLSKTFRCTRAIARYADTFLRSWTPQNFPPPPEITSPIIEAWDNAADGEEPQTLASLDASDIPLGSGILCRNNAPLVPIAYTLLRRGIPVRILGKRFGEDLVKIVTLLRCDFDDVPRRLEAWYTRQCERALVAGTRCDTIAEQYACLRHIHATVATKTIPGLTASITSLFVDEGDPRFCVTLSTMHKAKGLEYPYVYILDRNLCPSPHSETLAEQKQERNLFYVAITRAKEKLFFINSGGVK